MELERLRELIDLMIEKDVAELELEQHGVQVRIRRPGAWAQPAATVTMPRVAAPAAGALAAGGGAAGAEGVSSSDNEHVVRSPMVGTFFAAPEPKADNFVQVGDTVVEGQTLCIVEAMKLMNEITADVAGEVVAIYQENSEPVEYGQELMAIRLST